MTPFLIDIETTGLHARSDKICEIGLIRLEEDYTFSARDFPENSFASVVNGNGQFNLLDATRIFLKGDTRRFVLDMHEKSGLFPLLDTRKNHGNEKKRSNFQVESAAIKWLKELGADLGPNILVGSSLKLDRDFIDYHMPRLSAYFHYRMVDVSSLKELAQTFRPDLIPLMPKKADAVHRVVPDMISTYDELQLYKEKFLMTSVQEAIVTTATGRQAISYPGTNTDRCLVCDKPILAMAFQGSGVCGDDCLKRWAGKAQGA